MQRSSRRLIWRIGTSVVLASALALGGCGPEGDVSATGSTGSYLVMTRPASVPAAYVVTPNGYFHPDCVQEVAEDEVIRNDVGLAPGSARIERLDGSSARPLGACAHSRFTASGREIAATADRAPDDSAAVAAATPTINGWIESANSTAIGAVSYLHAKWNIPPAPSSHSGQTVYFFPGLEHAGGDTTILQPVLAWNQGGAAGSGWSLASWNCCVEGTTQHSGFIPAPGSTVSGDIGGTSCGSNGVCAHWKVVSYDWSSQRSTTLNTTAFGRTMNWVFGGALEAYNVGACNQLPGGSVTFSDFHINNARGTHVGTPAWNHDVGSPTPGCGYRITQSGSNVILHY